MCKHNELLETGSEGKRLVFRTGGRYHAERVGADTFLQEKAMYLGIDAGGTHTDAVLIEAGRVLCSAKTPTLHHNLPACIRKVLEYLQAEADLRQVRRVTLGSTLAVNALVQGKTDAVGLALSAGPGMDARRFALGDHVHVAPGGLDHRGVEVSPLDTASLRTVAQGWHEAGLRAFAVAGKFSPRNPAHEKAMAAVLADCGAVTQGHELSGLLNFPRRVAGAYFNAAVRRLHNAFLHAVEEALLEVHVHAPVFLLKADGGAAPLAWSRLYPVDSILSGPAASVMGVLALSAAGTEGDSALLDIGGTTTDMALYAGGCPVLERDGMRLPLAGRMHKTHSRALATVSLGVGGDSLLRVEGLTEGQCCVRVGPQRVGPAMAFGGEQPTLLDALNVLSLSGPKHGVASDTDSRMENVGDAQASWRGMQTLLEQQGDRGAAGQVSVVDLAQAALDDACAQVAAGLGQLLAHVNGHPVYTLAELLEGRELKPQCVWLVGAPADLMRQPLQKALALPVRVPPGAATANAVGAALTLPTAQLELFADTTQGLWRVPVLEEEGRTGKQFSLREAKEKALELLQKHARHSVAPGGAVQSVDVLEADVFATLDERGHGGKDMRVRCQLRPGIIQSVEF